MNISTKASQGKLWSTAPQYWSKQFEPYFLPMYKKVPGQLCSFLYHNIKEGIRSFMATGPAASDVDCRDKEIVEEAIAKTFPPSALAEVYIFCKINSRYLLLKNNFTTQ